MAGFYSTGQPLTVEEIAAAGEVLVNEGRKDISAIVDALLSIGVNDAAREVMGYSDNFAAECLAQMTAAKAAEILNQADMLAPKAYGILANLNGDQAQAILHNTALSLQKLIEIITWNRDDLKIDINKTLSGVILRRKIQVDSGITLTVGGQPGVLIASNIVCSGTITKSYSGASGGSSSRPGGDGGRGGGGLIIVCKSLNNDGTIKADGENGKGTTSGSSSGNGNAGGAGRYYVIGTDSAGKGGNGAEKSDPDGGGAGQVSGGGGGDDQISSYKGGAGGSCTVINFATANDLAMELRKAVVDWWLEQILGKTLSSSTEMPNVYGSGGGEGGAHSYHGGGGGGGGGQIIVLCWSFENNGTIRARGGYGGKEQGSAVTGYGGGGGGGGGGIVYVFYHDLISSGTLSAPGGGVYYNVNPGTPGDPGTAKKFYITA